MTVQGRDASNFDLTVDDAGLGFLTHKATEGTTVVHDKYGARLAAARSFGVPVLGAYHVVRTPGSDGNGSLAAQLAFFLGYLDAHTPWWRTASFILQLDAERWPYDDVAPATVLQFARLLVGAGVPGYKITYASRGQYGDALAGIATDLWNADYRASTAGSYPGDGWTSYGGRPAGWAPFSGQTPRFLQYTSTPYDKDAFRGSLQELLALIGGDTMASAAEINASRNSGALVQLLDDYQVIPGDVDGAAQVTVHNPFVAAIKDIQANAARAAAVQVMMTDDQVAALGAQLAARLDARLEQLPQLLAKAAQAAAAALAPPAQ